jgi:hypothetical protein
VLLLLVHRLWHSALILQCLAFTMFTALNSKSLSGTLKPWLSQVGSLSPPCSVDSLCKLMTPQVKCLVVNVPHNPTGWLPTQQEWEKIVQAAAQVKVFPFIWRRWVQSSLAASSALNEGCSWWQ